MHNNHTTQQLEQFVQDESRNKIFASKQVDWTYQSRKWKFCRHSALWETYLTNAKHSKRIENNQNDDCHNCDINNKKDLDFSFIESFESFQNLSLNVNENTFLSLKKITQTLSNVDFFDIDEFLRQV